MEAAVIAAALDADLGSAFFSDSFEQQPLFKSKCRFGHLATQTITIEHFEEWLWLAHKYKRSAIQISRNSETLKDVSRRERDICLELPQLLEDGYSIALNSAEDFSSPLAVLVREFGRWIGAVSHASIFLTPSDASTFKTHHDTIDVFAVQIEGSKNWALSNTPSQLPLLKHTYLDDRLDLPLKYQMNPGDILYIPRGVAHNVSTGESSFSLHVSIGISCLSVSSILSETFNVLKEDQIDLRRSVLLPAGRGASGYLTPKSIGKDLASNCSNPFILKTAASRILAGRWSEMPQPSGRLRQHLRGIPTVTNASQLRRRSGMPCEITILGSPEEVVGIGFPGLGDPRLLPIHSLLLFPFIALTALEFIRDTPTAFRVGDLPGLISTEGKITIANRLVCEGLLEFLS